MCCVLIWELVVSKIREKVCEEEILQLYCKSTDDMSSVEFCDLFNTDVQIYH
jgi:hypothetical protein